MTITIRKAALAAAAAAALSAVFPAAAADVNVYGAIDAGLYLTDAKHSNANLKMQGTDISTLWGIHAKEDLGDGRWVAVKLESGFDGQTGQIANDTREGAFFSRDSIVVIGNDRLGEVAFGRTGGLLGSTGSYAQWAANQMNPLYSNNPDGALPGAFQSSPIVDNAITFRTAPILGGLRFIGQYSNSTDQVAHPESEGFSKSEHLYALGAAWNTGRTTALFVTQVIDYAEKATNTTPNNARSTVNVFAGASTLLGETRVHVAYQHLENARGVLGAPNVISATQMGFDGATSSKGFRADSVSLGANHPLWGGKIHGSIKMVRASWEGNDAREGLDDEGERWVGAVRYSYPFSKRTTVYAVGTYAYSNGMFRNTEKAEETSFRSTVALGLSHKF